MKKRQETQCYLIVKKSKRKYETIKNLKKVTGLMEKYGFDPLPVLKKIFSMYD